MYFRLAEIRLRSQARHWVVLYDKTQYSIVFRTGSVFLEIRAFLVSSNEVEGILLKYKSKHFFVCMGLYCLFFCRMPRMRCMQYGSPLLEVLSSHIQRLTVSRSSHSSVKFNVQRRILDFALCTATYTPCINISWKDRNVAC